MNQKSARAIYVPDDNAAKRGTNEDDQHEAESLHRHVKTRPTAKPFQILGEFWSI
jgi:hypothetical protein